MSENQPDSKYQFLVERYTLEESFTIDEPDFIQFSIIPESDTTMFWKLFIGIECSRISRANQCVLNKTILSLNQFLSVYQSFTQQLLILEKNPSNNLYNSTTQQDCSLFSTARLSFPVFDSDECFVCMDRQSNLVLPCTHKICDECFKQWSTEISVRGYQTCPMCRSDVNIDDGFMLVEISKSDNVKRAITESILALPNDYKKKNMNDN